MTKGDFIPDSEDAQVGKEKNIYNVW